LKRQFVLLAVTLCAIVGVAFGQAQTGKLKLQVFPTRAGVFVDGKYVGPAGNFGFPTSYALPAGEHQILLTEPRYKDVTTTVTITAGKSTKLKSTMEALPPAQGPFGLLKTVYPDKFAAVFLNNKYYGHAGEFDHSKQGLKVPVGEYDLRIVPVTGQEHTEKVKIEGDKVTVINATK
jgi:hypothetical protein